MAGLEDEGTARHRPWSARIGSVEDGAPQPRRSLVPEAGLEPARRMRAVDFESTASTDFATPAGMALSLAAGRDYGMAARPDALACAPVQASACCDNAALEVSWLATRRWKM